MPLLPHTRGRDDISALEDVLDRCVAEARKAVGASWTHMSMLRTYSDRLHDVRTALDQARQEPH
jgi:hypothetical protein